MIPRGVKKERLPRKGKQSRLRRIVGFAGTLTSCFLKAACALIGVAAVSLLFVLLYDTLVKSPYMKLEKVLVEGVDEDFKQEVLRVANLDPDSTLLTVNLDELKKRIEENPWIKEARLEKRFPRALMIHVEKEAPRAVVAADKLYYMNRQGIVFAEVDREADLDYPVVTGLSPHLEGEAASLKLASRVLDSLESEEKPWSTADLSEIHFNGDGNVLLYFYTLPVVKVRAADLARKMKDLKRVVDHLQDTGRIHMVKGINLDYHDGAVVSYNNT